MGTSGADEPLRVVLVDTREERRHLMVSVVEGDGGRAVVVAEADGPEAAVYAVREEEAEAAVVDVWMPVAVGLRTLGVLRRSFPALPIVVCSFDMDAGTVRDALGAGADACLRKPASPHELVEALTGARDSAGRTLVSAPAA